MLTDTPAPTETTAPLDLDERLVLAALAVSDSGPLDLADVVTGPVTLPAPPVRPYPTPVAALLQRAARRLEVDGWCRGSTVDASGARCLYGAIHAEAAGPGEESTALAVLEDAVRRHWRELTATIPTVNDTLLPDGRAAVRLLDDSALLADARGL